MADRHCSRLAMTPPNPSAAATRVAAVIRGLLSGLDEAEIGELEHGEKRVVEAARPG